MTDKLFTVTQKTLEGMSRPANGTCAPGPTSVPMGPRARTAPKAAPGRQISQTMPHSMFRFEYYKLPNGLELPSLRLHPEPTVAVGFITYWLTMLNHATAPVLPIGSNT